MFLVYCRIWIVQTKRRNKSVRCGPLIKLWRIGILFNWQTHPQRFRSSCHRRTKIPNYSVSTSLFRSRQLWKCHWKNDVIWISFFNIFPPVQYNYCNRVSLILSIMTLSFFSPHYFNFVLENMLTQFLGHSEFVTTLTHRV